ncbi:hypothetical protein [Streptomyces sp. NPDC050121]
MSRCALVDPQQASGNTPRLSRGWCELGEGRAVLLAMVETVFQPA